MRVPSSLGNLLARIRYRHSVVCFPSKSLVMSLAHKTLHVDQQGRFHGVLFRSYCTRVLRTCSYGRSVEAFRAAGNFSYPDHEIAKESFIPDLTLAVGQGCAANGVIGPGLPALVRDSLTFRDHRL